MRNEGGDHLNNVEAKGFAKNRVEAFSDGIFAVALPLLILEIHPWDVDLSDSNKWLDLWPLLVTCVFSFLIIGVYWIAHHNEFDLIGAVNRLLLWLDLLFLLSVLFIPVSTGLLGKYWAKGGDWQRHITVWAYAVNVIITGLLLEVLWLYATYRNKLRIPLEDPRVNETIKRNLYIPAAYIGVIVISYFKVEWGYGLLMIIPIIYIIWTIWRRPDPAKQDA